MHPVVRSILQSGFTKGKSYYDGSGDYLSVGVVSDWNFLHQVGTTGKWTIERRFQAASFSAVQALFDTASGTTSNSGIYIKLETSRAISVQMMRGVAGSYVVNHTTPTGVFPNDTSNLHLIEITYDQTLASNNLKIFIDGTLVSQATKTANAASASNCNTPLKISTFGTGLGEFVNGYDDAIRISDIVRHTTNYVPETSFGVDGNTKLNLQFAEPIGSTTFIDDTGKTVTTNGNVVIVE